MDWLYSAYRFVTGAKRREDEERRRLFAGTRTEKALNAGKVRIRQPTVNGRLGDIYTPPPVPKAPKINVPKLTSYLGNALQAPAKISLSAGKLGGEFIKSVPGSVGEFGGAIVGGGTQVVKDIAGLVKVPGQISKGMSDWEKNKADIQKQLGEANRLRLQGNKSKELSDYIAKLNKVNAELDKSKITPASLGKSLVSGVVEQVKSPFLSDEESVKQAREYGFNVSDPKTARNLLATYLGASLYTRKGGKGLVRKIGIEDTTKGIQALLKEGTKFSDDVIREISPQLAKIKNTKTIEAILKQEAAKISGKTVKAGTRLPRNLARGANLTNPPKTPPGPGRLIPPAKGTPDVDLIPPGIPSEPLIDLTSAPIKAVRPPRVNAQAIQPPNTSIGKTYYRGINQREWDALRSGKTSRSVNRPNEAFISTDKSQAQMAAEAQARRGRDTYIVEYKPGTESKITRGGEKGYIQNPDNIIEGEYLGRNLGINNIARVTDKNGKVVYQAQVGRATPEPDVVLKNLTTKERAEVDKVAKALGVENTDELAKQLQPKAASNISEATPTKGLSEYGITEIKNNKQFESAVTQVAKADNLPVADARIRVQTMLDEARVRSADIPRQTTPAPRYTIKGKPQKDPKVKALLQTLSKGKAIASTEESMVANSIRLKAKELGVKLDRGFRDRYQSGSLNTGSEMQMGEFIRETTDKLFPLQKQLSPNVKYRQRFLPQAFKQTQEVIEETARKLNLRTASGQPRKFRSFAEAEGVGLEARYKGIDQMIGANARELHQALNNQKAIKQGLSEGLFDTSPKNGWTPVEGFFSGGNEQIYAQKALADVLNGVFQKETTGFGKVAQKVATGSKGLQSVTLSGGVKQYNFFTLSQAMTQTSRNIGTFLTGRPVQAFKQEGHTLADLFFHSHSLNRTAKRWQKNADFIRDLSKEGLDLGTQSSLLNAEKNLASRGWDKLFQNATFARYLPNRMLSTAQETYRLATKKGMTHDEAIKLAADTTKKLNGLMDDVAKGRTKLTKDMIASVAFAPRYREGIIRTLGNAVRSVVDPRTFGNKQYRASRELAVGMLATAVAYDTLNYRLNGHHMWENREGQETSLQIPHGEKDEKGNQPVVNIPFMPGFATIPRALIGMVGALARGDGKEFVAEGSKMASSWLQTAGRVVGNKDYFGRPIYISQDVAREEGLEADKAIEALKKIGWYITGQSVPSYGRGVIDYAQGKPITQALAQAAEAPLRFGKVLNPDTRAYIDEDEKAQAGLNANQKAAWRDAFPETKNILGDRIKDVNPGERIRRSTILRANRDVFEKRATMERNIHNKTGQAIDPIYQLSWDKAHKVLWARSFAPGESGDTKQELVYKQPWYEQFKKKENAYYDSLSKFFAKKKADYKKALASGKLPKERADNLRAELAAFKKNEDLQRYYNYPKETPQLEKLQATYYRLPKGTGDRSDFIDANPQLTQYWDKQRAATNRYRKVLGLPLLKDSNFAKGGGKSKGGNRGGRRSGGRKTSVPAPSLASYLGTIRAPARIRLPQVARQSSVRVPGNAPRPTIKVNFGGSNRPTFGGPTRQGRR